MAEEKYELKREISCVGRYKIIVIGGGMGGFGAACAAARRGCKTLLIERFSQLGGLGTLAGVGNFSFCGSLKGQGRVFEDILTLLQHLKAFGEEHGWLVKKDTDSIRESVGREYLGSCRKSKDSKVLKDRKNYMFDHNVLPLVLQQIAQESNVDLLLHTEVVDVIKSDKKAVAVVTHNRDLLQAYQADIIIDGTGDGIVAQHAGAEVLKDDSTHTEQLPTSLMIFLRKTEREQEQVLLEEPACEKEIPQYQIWEEADGKIGLKAYFKGFDVGTGRDFSSAEIFIREKIPAVVRHYQKIYDSRYKLDYAAPLLGIREGRRIKGDYILTVDDVRSGNRFKDSVAFGSYTIDSKEIDESLPPYQIPLRSLLVAGVDNMMVVGRCLSADRLAMSSARVMATCCLTGQAAGIAAVLACQKRVNLRKVDPAEVRKYLISAAYHKELMKKSIIP